MVQLTDSQEDFPDSFEIYEGEFVGSGGILTPKLLLSAYTKGVFPMFLDDIDQPMWFCPIPRLLLKPTEIRIQKSIRSSLQKFQYGINLNFDAVIAACKNTPRKGDPGTWINEKITQPFTELHNLNLVHSIEVFSDGKLVGGLYGIVLGGCFFGESMFQQETNASKCGLIVLCKILESCGFHFIDCQQATAHLTFMGGKPIEADDFFEQLNNGLQDQTPQHRFAAWSGQKFSYHKLCTFLNAQ